MTTETFEIDGFLADFFRQSTRQNFTGLLFFHEVKILLETLGGFANSDGWNKTELAQAEVELKQLFNRADSASKWYARIREYVDWAIWLRGPFAKVLTQNAKNAYLDWLESDISRPLDDVAYVRMAVDACRVEVAMAVLLVHYEGHLGFQRFDNDDSEALSSPILCASGDNSAATL